LQQGYTVNGGNKQSLRPKQGALNKRWNAFFETIKDQQYSIVEIPNVFIKYAFIHTIFVAVSLCIVVVQLGIMFA
jgi:hypothetical protein